MIEVLHAFTLSDHDAVPYVTKLYSQFLMVDDSQVSFAAKQALVRALRPRARRRKVVIPSPPYCSTPPPPQQQRQEQQQGQQQQQEEEDADPDNLQFHDAVPMQQGQEEVEGALNVGPGGVQLGGIAGNLDALLGGGGGNHPGGGQAGGGAAAAAAAAANMLDAMAGDVDDEAMVELAIALSLQDQQGDQQLGENLQQGLAGLQHGLQQLVN